MPRDGGHPEQGERYGKMPRGVAHLGEVASMSESWKKASVGVHGCSATDVEDDLHGDVLGSFDPWSLRRS